MSQLITSASNERIKQVVRLAKSNERREQNLFIIEGLREVQMAIDAGFQIESLFYCNDIAQVNALQSLRMKLSSSCQLFEVSASVFKKVAYREQSDGVLALAPPRYKRPEEIPLPHDPLIIVIESVEKPGNLGAILRTADAAAVAAVFVCDRQTDIYNPNVVRSSLGCIFSCNVVVCDSEEAIAFFKQKKINMFAASLDAQEYYQDIDFKGASAIVMGSEANGLSKLWLQESDKLVKIPMCGKVDSLNVSVSTAILVYEAQRQRGFRK